MQYQRLGRSGLKVSRFSIGSWVTFGGQVGEEETRRCLLAAYDRGVNFIDNAEAYAGGEAERVVGRAIRELPRSALVLSSKVFWGGEGPNEVGLSRKRVVEACHAALRRLGTDYLDLYFCHRHDPDTPLEETAFTMDQLVRQGKVLYWGTSEWTAGQLEALFRVCSDNGFVPPTMEQPEYNLFRRERVERELVPLVERHGLGLTTWSPLASGLLTGKYDQGVPPESRGALEGYEWLAEEILLPDRVEAVRKLEPLAREVGCTRAQLALAWCARSPHVSTVITGASRVEQVHENLDALDVIPRLTDEVTARIEAVL